MSKVARFVKKFGAAVGGAMSGALVGLASSINIPLLGGAILTGAFPFIAAVVYGVWIGYELHHYLKGVDIVHVTPIVFQVEVIA